MIQARTVLTTTTVSEVFLVEAQAAKNELDRIVRRHRRAWWWQWGSAGVLIVCYFALGIALNWKWWALPLAAAALVLYMRSCWHNGMGAAHQWLREHIHEREASR